MVDHEILLSTLNHTYSIDGTAEWVRNYLVSRDMKMRIGKSYSQQKELTFSVPQGSCSGTNFFNMYYSIISEVINPNVGIIVFADDHAIVKEYDPNILAEEMQTRHILITSLANVKSWLNSIRLKMNNVKSEFIFFSNRVPVSKCISSEININGEAGGRSPEIKYLGAWLDSELTLKMHLKGNV